jgi:hypothetical protein
MAIDGNWIKSENTAIKWRKSKVEAKKKGKPERKCARRFAIFEVIIRLTANYFVVSM